MSFGLKNNLIFFSKLMSGLLKEMKAFAVPYLDDVAIFLDTWKAHLKHVCLVLDRIKKTNLKIKPSKCKFARNYVKYLGHVVGNGTRSPAEAKIESVQKSPTPRTNLQIRAFLELAEYYDRYINNFSVPLTDALKEKTTKDEITLTARKHFVH